MDTVDGSNTDDLWTPYKELVSIVENNLGRADNGPYTAFESALRRHKQTFLSLMKNSPKNAVSREEIRRGVTEGVNLPSTGRTILSRELVDEAIIISDMYDVNEYAALELLHTAQRHAPRHPGLPRGLVAVLLYYDGRRAIVQALKELIMARRGVSWCVEASSEVISHVTSYVDSLLSSGLLGRVLDALDSLDLANEVALLQSNRALGGPRHNAQVVATLEDIRRLLAGTAFSASAQQGLTKDTLLRLLTQLCREANPAGGAATGTLDDVALALHMALLYGIDLSVIHRRDDGEDLARTLPLITDTDLLPALLTNLAPLPPENANGATGARALAQLALGLALAALRRAPSLVGIVGDALEQDELLVEAAVDGNVFEYIHEVLLSNECVHKNEYYMRRLHTLITDFVVLMHSKLMDLRLKADEAARATQLYAAEGLSETVPAPRGHFHALLHCVERLYEVDAWALRADYWAAADYQHSHSYRSGGRSVSLFKFVRLAGELVAPPLLAPYLRALASLAVAPHTHALLARRDAPAAHAVSAAAVSWDHLFGALARYYCNLRQDPTPLVDHHSSSLGGSAVTGAAGTVRGRRMVRPDEVEALIAALRLVRAVARVDAHACAAVSEHPQWDAINCMFGLIGCHIPLRLKAELALALAALGSTAGTAPRVWAALEAAQLIRTVPTTNTYTVGTGVEAELEEVESRDEEYPLTRAMLTLLTSLCTAAPAPRALGAGPRAPGLAPYAAYAVRAVALTAPHRGYRDAGEKWQVLSLALRLFTTWLLPYIPMAADYPRSAAEASAPPGWALALQLHTQTPLLGLVLSLMEECVVALAGWGAVAGKNHLEDCALSCLQLIDKALLIERQFITEFTPICNILITGLSKLLLGTNLGAGKSEPVLNIARMVTFGSQLQRHALLAVSVLTQLAALPGAHQHVLYVLTADEATRVEIRHGFVECLEAEDLSDTDQETAPSTVRQTQESILRLLQRTVALPAPSLAHYLLGFKLTGDISQTAFCEPGVNGFPRTCLHSVLDILDDSIAGSKLMGHRWPVHLLEQAYCLLYTVCARPQTSAPVLRYLRSRDAFLVRHVRATPAPENASASWLCARAWLLRASACELGASAAAKQDSALGLLVRALTDTPQDRRVGRLDTTTSDTTAGSAWCGLRRLLEGLATTSAVPPEPRWEFFHAPQLRAALESCEQTAVGNTGVGVGGKRINVTRLHALLARELGALQATAPQRGLVAREIEKVLEYATQINKQRNLASSLILYYDSWRQIAEILFCVASQEILPLDAKQSLLLNILQDILNKISPADVLPQLGNLASGTILLLLVNLRHCYVTERRRSDLKLSDFEMSFFGPSNNLMQTNSLSLKFILQKILNWILVSGVSTQKMRINLYSALLNYMHIVNLKTGYEDLVSVEDSLNTTYVSRLDSSKMKLGKEESSLRSMVIEVIAGFGDSLCNIVCADCVGAGHEVCRMVALSCLDTLLEIHPHTDWLNILTNKGYLRNLIDSLLQDDAGLIQVLEPSPPSLKALYVYESKLTLLSKMASSRVGAETVLAQGALSCLANMRVFDYHPDIQSGYPGPEDLDTDFIPPVSERYRSILAPALSLCDALLTTLGSENHSCLLHVTHWLLSHADAVETVLRAANPKSPTGLLQELEGISSVISRATSPEVFSYVERDVSLQDSGVTLYRIQALMLALFPRFNSMLKDINMGATRPSQFLSINSRMSADKSYLGEDNFEDTPDRAVLCLKIICNLLTYMRNVTRGSEQRVLFKPTLTASSGQWNETGDRAPHLGVLVQQLEYTVKHCQTEKNALEILNSHLRRVPDMTIAELQELVPSAERDGRARALQRVARRLAAKRREVALAVYAIESCLHLLWAHLDYYMRRAVPAELSTMGGELTLSTCLSPGAAVYKTYSSELSELKQGLVSVFNDTFTKDLLDTSAEQGSSQRGLIDILLRDIKCLVQFVPVK